MLEAFSPAKLLIADKAYDADRLRTWLQDRGIEAVIPGRAARAVVYPLNRTAYRRRNVIERMFGRLKNWKRIATRYDRLAINYLAAIVLVATISQWLGRVPDPDLSFANHALGFAGRAKSILHRTIWCSPRSHILL